VVGVSGDLIEEYLARVRAQLRTSGERTAQILAEAEDHLRESVAAGVAVGMTEREAQEAAISAFGSVRAVVRAHRRPVPATAAAVSMAVWKLAAIYLLAVPATDLVLTTLFFFQVHRTALGPTGHVAAVANGPASVVTLVAGGIASAIGGLALLLGYRRVRRSRRRREQPARAPLGGFFPLAAAIFMLFAGPTAAALIAPHVHLFRGFAVLAEAAVAASVLVALGYAASMVMTLARQRGAGGTGEQEVPYAR
jgi:hypothetical protein